MLVFVLAFILSPIVQSIVRFSIPPSVGVTLRSGASMRRCRWRPMGMTVWLSVWLTVCLLVSASVWPPVVRSQYPGAEPCPEELRPGFDSITAQQTQAMVNVLAGPNFEGRGTGQKGYAKAAFWVAGKLAEYGVEPIYADGNYFQSVPLQQKIPILQECYLRAAGGVTIPAKGNLGFDTYSPKPSVLGRLLFVRCPEGRFKIPANVQLRDAIVVYWASDASLKYASRKIASHQPVAMLHVVDTRPRSIRQSTFAGQPAAAIKGKIYAPAVDQLLDAVGLDVAGLDVAGLGDELTAELDNRQSDQLNKKVNSDPTADNPTEMSSSPHDSPSAATRWVSQPADEIVALDPRSNVALANPVRVREITSPNVIGVIPGSDPQLRNEHIIVGSHLDHIGVTSGGIFAGADDNASGCSAVLSIAKALMTNPVRPKRSVMFIFFAAEEIGLVGSNHYCKRPLLPLRDATCMLNIDMVGRNESSAKESADENEGSIHLIGAKQGGNVLHDVILDANRHVGFRFEFDEESIFNRSDQFNFYRQGVGVAFLFGGFHPDYHQRSDLPERLNHKKIQAAARLYYLTIFKADQHGPFPVEVQRPTIDPTQARKTITNQSRSNQSRAGGSQPGNVATPFNNSPRNK